MALTQTDWYERLKAWVPGWVFEGDDSEVSDAVFYAMAKLLSTMDDERAELLLFTYIDSAVTPYLELLGDERSVDRLSGESNALYRQRIKTRNISSKCSYPEIDAIAQDAMTVNVVVKEDQKWGFFCDAGSYLNRGDILFDWIENGGFSVIVDRGADPDEVEAMILSINRNKAFGVLYRVVERYISGTLLLTEEGDDFITEEGDLLIGG
jgi:hypothetical protein